jgi:hypothetical protein
MEKRGGIIKRCGAYAYIVIGFIRRVIFCPAIAFGERTAELNF